MKRFRSIQIVLKVAGWLLLWNFEKSAIWDSWKHWKKSNSIFYPGKLETAIDSVKYVEGEKFWTFIGALKVEKIVDLMMNTMSSLSLFSSVECMLFTLNDACWPGM